MQLYNINIAIGYIMSHSLAFQNTQLVKYIPTFAKATLKWATSWSENQSSPKSQVPIWKAANPSGNLFKTLSTFSCPFWTLRSVDARHEFWSLKSKFESQSLGLKLGIPWDTQTECLKKSRGRCLCVVIAWQNIAEAAIGCLQNTCRAFALARVNRATKEKVNLNLNETLVIDVEKYNNGLKQQFSFETYFRIYHSLGSATTQPTTSLALYINSLLGSTLVRPHLVLLHRSLGELLHPYYS